MARYDLSEVEWRLIAPLLPNKPRGVARVDDRRIINASSIFCAPARPGVICRIAMVPTPPPIIAGPRQACGCGFSRRWQRVRRTHCI